MSSTNEKAFDIAKRLAETGVGYAKIADALNQSGIRSKCVDGLWTIKRVSEELIAGGYRRRTFAERGGDKAPVALAPVVTPTTKWEVLQSIERCADFNGPTKKALLDLVWKELNK